MSTHDHHYRVNWKQLEDAYQKYGSQILNGDTSIFLEDVGRTKIRSEKYPIHQLTCYYEYFSDDASDHQRGLMTFMKSFSPYFKGSPPPHATYHDPNGYGLAFSPDDAAPIQRLAATISISKALYNYDEFLESNSCCSRSMSLIWIERYLATVLEFWSVDYLPAFGMVYTRF